ncbi:hypothetical protein [Pandoravirus japonicus]|uniref:Uncharacterized protein n=1 Tax=Pandoravirus japonicus TaxID=2823154 RepID=A0A811BPR6_9VIRU|nr:hypothetical protein [Pandoravirus japonicus]
MTRGNTRGHVSRDGCKIARRHRRLWRPHIFFLFFPPLAPLPTKAMEGEREKKKDGRDDGALGPVVGADPRLLLPIPPRPHLQKALALADIDRPHSANWSLCFCLKVGQLQFMLCRRLAAWRMAVFSFFFI